MKPTHAWLERWLPGLAVGSLAAWLYLHAFGSAPVYLGGDEAHFAIQAHAIATTGHDLNGRFLPLFVNLHGPLGPQQSSTRWYQPLNFYLIALTLRALPLAEWSIRVPGALIAVLNVLLVYALALRLFPGRVYPILAAVFLVLTPAHLIFARQALDYLLPVPFVLGWLLCLARALETGSVRASFLGGLLLGLGMFSYLAAWLLMPCFLALGWIAQFLSGRRAAAASLAAALGFAAPLLVLVLWLSGNPNMVSETLSRYSPPGTSHLTPLQRVKDFLNYNNVQDKISIYWDYFNPAFLFLSGGSNLTMATRRAGIFLLPVALFLLCGVYDLLKRVRVEPIAIVLIGGCAFCAVPPSLVGESFAIQRELGILPFAAVIATYGVARLWRQSSRVLRVATALLLLALPFHYAYFYRDYFGDYRIRAAYWFDPIDFRGVAAYLISKDVSGELPAVYFAEDLDDVGARWHFYLAKSGRAHLLRRTRFFRADLFDSRSVPPGRFMVLYVNDPNVNGLLGTGLWAVATTIHDEATGSKTAIVLRKNP